MIITDKDIYINNGDLYLKIKNKSNRGMPLWKPIKKIFGIFYVSNGEEFYLDDFGFNKIT